MKSIDGIKIIQVDGLKSLAALRVMQTRVMWGAETWPEQALSTLSSYRTQDRSIDCLLNEIGVSDGSLAALTPPLTSTTPVEENVE